MIDDFNEMNRKFTADQINAQARITQRKLDIAFAQAELLIEIIQWNQECMRRAIDACEAQAMPKVSVAI